MLKAIKKLNPIHRATGILAFSGLVIVVLMALAVRHIRTGYAQTAACNNLIMECRQVLATGQLHYDRIADSNQPRAMEDEVLKPLSRIIHNLEAFYAGDRPPGFDLPEPDEDTRVLIKNFLYDVQRISTGINQQRQAGTFVKSEIDNAFEQASHSLDRLAGLLAVQVKAISVRMQSVSLLMLVLLAGVFTISVFMYFRSNRQKNKLIKLTASSLEEEKSRVDTLSRFIEAISNGDYSVAIGTDDKSGLTARLLSMRDNLKANADEDARRNWATQGLAQIGEILRETGNAAALYDKLIKFVVNYTGSNQGGLFLLNDDDEHHPFLELVSAYAFERKKFISKQVDIGQGMVGQCYQEADRIFLTKLPEEYVHITSGLGGATPTCLLLVPLKANDKVYGVLELASFKQLAEHQIRLIEKFAESIAATVSAVKINESTRMLLERTQQQAEEMRAQEEEMRQNMEELSATQEEMARKEREYIKRISELEEQVNSKATAG
ncbi:MAG: GAF domain-containing protein [Flammeovirgaceae bacterium]|nr:MAG: GAF domain-containing protein [Flammeovirgaceae bacterium]